MPRVVAIDMARREVKKKPPKRNDPLLPKRVLKDVQLKEPEIEEQEDKFTDPDVERQIAAIRAIRDVEIEHLQTEIRLLRSYFNKEQSQTQVLKFFADNFPALSVVKTGSNGRIEIQFQTERDKAPKEITRDSHISLLRRLSMARSEFSAPFSSFGGFEFSTKAAKTRLVVPDDLQIGAFVLDEPYDSQMVGMQDAFRTPGISNQRLSMGMTPKTLRLPKPGEMLLSIRGSPLGVYKEDNMEAICESEER